MSGYGMADSAELAVLTKALDDYCARHGIEKGPCRDDVAMQVLRLFQQGVTEPARLADGLESSDGRTGRSS